MHTALSSRRYFHSDDVVLMIYRKIAAALTNTQRDGDAGISNTTILPSINDSIISARSNTAK